LGRRPATSIHDDIVKRAPQRFLRQSAMPNSYDEIWAPLAQPQVLRELWPQMLHLNRLIDKRGSQIKCGSL
jgi:hypothetical protein